MANVSNCSTNIMDLGQPFDRMYRKKKPFIYEFSCSGGEKYWVAAENKPEAIECYVNETGEEVETTDTITRLKKDQLNGHYVLDINEWVDNDDIEKMPQDEQDEYHTGYKIVESFAEVVERYKSPELIATTDF